MTGVSIARERVVKFPWTPEQDAELLRLNAEGYSSREMGVELHRTRNSCLGRLYRLGVLKTMARGHVRPIGTPGPRTRKSASPSLPSVSRAIPAPVLRLVPIEPIPGRLQVWDLQQHHCRFPHGHPRDPDFHFCGRQKTETSPYCAEHRAIVYTATKTRDRDPNWQRPKFNARLGKLR